MSLLLLAAGVALCLAGTRAAAVAFAAAAFTADAPAGTWIGFTAAGLVAIGVPPRRIALPATGAVAALVAVRAGNLAAVLPAWSVAAACALAGRDRRSHLLLAADLPLVAAVLWTVASTGFEAWQPPGIVPAWLLLAAAALRIGAAGRPDTVLLVRAQAAGLLALAIAGPPAVAGAVVLLGPVVFAAAVLAPARDARDAVQELSLYALGLAAVRCGWPLAGGAWLALGGGTVLHLLRTSAGPAWLRSPAALLRGGALGLPLLPAVAAAMGASLRAGGAVAAWVCGLLLMGVAVRTGTPAVERRRPVAPGPVAGVLLAGAAAMAVAGGPWIVVAAGAAMGALLPRRLAPGRPRRPPEPAAAGVLSGAVGWSPSEIGLSPAPAIAAMAAVSAGVWVLGYVRGFL